MIRLMAKNIFKQVVLIIAVLHACMFSAYAQGRVILGYDGLKKDKQEYEYVEENDTRKKSVQNRYNLKTPFGSVRTSERNRGVSALNKGTYVIASLGVATSSGRLVGPTCSVDSKLNCDSSGDSGTGGSFYLGFGTYARASLRAEVGYLNYTGLKFGTKIHMGDIGGYPREDPTIASGGAMESTAIMGALYYDFNSFNGMGMTMVPFIGFGIGYTYNKVADVVIDDIEGYDNGNYGDDLDMQDITEFWDNGKIVNFGNMNQDMAWMAVVGVSFHLDKNILVDFTYRYTNLGEYKTREDSSSTYEYFYICNGVIDCGDGDDSTADSYGETQKQYLNTGAQTGNIKVSEFSLGVRVTF